MKLTVLGDYGGYPFDSVGTSGYLLTSGKFNMLVDCGSGVLLSLEKVLNPLKLDSVILSHYHADHIADVGVLQYYWQLHPDRYKTAILPIYGNTEDELHFNELSWPNSTVKRPFHENEELQIGPFKFNFLKTIHPIPAYAMRIEDTETGQVLSYTADTRYFDGLIDFVADSDLLIADTNFFDRTTGTLWHMTASQSGQLAREAHCKTLMISHLPQNGNHETLRQEAQQAASSAVKVELPIIRKEIEI